MITDNQRVVMLVLRDQFNSGTLRRITDAVDRSDYGTKRYRLSQVSGYLYRLQKRGLVKSVRSEGGHRAVRWSLTEAGQQELNNEL